MDGSSNKLYILNIFSKLLLHSRTYCDNKAWFLSPITKFSRALMCYIFPICLYSNKRIYLRYTLYIFSKCLYKWQSSPEVM